MPKQSLVVVESAAKARTIEKILGRGYAVRACLGHVRDLPTSRLGVDVEHGFQPQYVVPKDRKDVVKKLKDEARGKNAVLLATDPDREGEAIAWHLLSALGLDGDQPVSRIEFHEVTRGAVQAALNNPRTIDMHRVDAQQARRVVDRLIGYPVSTFLGRKVRRGLSAGRVQSVAVRIIVDREKEIQAFVPVEYWTLQAELARHAQRATFVANLVERQGEKIDLKTGVEAASVQADLDGARWQVAGVREREQQRHPDAPFTTSTLQQDASRKLGYGASRTMRIAQQLYEGKDVGGGESVGLITYMRTDSVNVAQVALDEARDYIRAKFAGDMLPAQPRTYRTRSKLAQEAHEAIRPTSVFREPEQLRAYLEPEQYRLYDLIWKRFVASQMSSAVFDVTTVDVDARAPAKPSYRFRASGSRLKFAGFLTLYRAGQEDDEATSDEDRQPLPELAAGDQLDLQRLIPEQHFTQPPPRYTEATLVKFLEERGIGRPSTYAPILSTIQDRGYVERDGRRLKPTELGILVNDLLVQQFGDIMDLDFTALLEDKLDDVAQGERQWVPVVAEFYAPLNRDLERANTIERLRPAEIETDEVCSQGHPMVIKEGRFGRFLACTKYPEHKETRPLPEELPPDAPEEQCSHGVTMQLRTGRFGPFYTSTHDCGETKPFARRVGVQCPVDGGEILEKRSKKGRIFYGCANWPNCDWVSFNRPLQEPCPQCGGLQVDMGRGRVRCLKHEGEPPRFAARANGTAKTASSRSKGSAKPASSRASGATKTATARKSKTTTRKPTTRRKTVAAGK
jgi:DNA topoisomerase I